MTLNLLTTRACGLALTVFAFFALLPSAAFCNDIEKSTDQAPHEDIFDKSRDAIGDAYINLADRVDLFVSRRDYARNSNNSRLALSLGNTWFEGGDQEYDIKLRTRVDLPGTEEKFKLFFESDPDEGKSLADRNRSVARNDRVTRSQSVAGIEYSKPTEPDRWKHSGSVGGNYNEGIDLLLRYRLRRYWQVGEDTTFLFRQDLWHKSSVGWGETTHLELTKPLKSYLWLNVTAELEVRDHDKPMEYANIWRMDHQLTDQWSLTYKLGLLGESDEDDNNHLFDDRFISTTLGYTLDRRWVSIYFTPEIYYPEDSDYKPEYSFTLTCSLQFTDEKN